VAVTVKLLDSAFNPGALLGPFSNDHPGLGGLCSFIGEVRGGDGTQALELLHYERMTLKGMEDLAQRTSERFDLMGLMIIHRHGIMLPREPIVMVAAAASHRRAAIEAVDFAMDHLKSNSWFWKREKRDGEWHWIEPRDQDHADLSRWD